MEANQNVGPVLQAGVLSAAVIKALQALNEKMTVLDHGAYLRVCCPPPCRLDARLVEKFSGEPFQLPSDLEMIMPSFKGKITFLENEVQWTSAKEANPL